MRHLILRLIIYSAFFLPLLYKLFNFFRCRARDKIIIDNILNEEDDKEILENQNRFNRFTRILIVFFVVLLIAYISSIVRSIIIYLNQT